MFGGYGAPSIADIAAVTEGRNNGGWGDGNGWWILIILFAIFGGWGRNGFGNGSGCGCDGACATVGDVERGFNQQSTNMRFNAVDGAFAQLGYANQQNAYETRLAIANTQAQQQQCCCDTQRAIAQAQNQLSSQTPARLRRLFPTPLVTSPTTRMRTTVRCMMSSRSSVWRIRTRRFASFRARFRPSTSRSPRPTRTSISLAGSSRIRSRRIRLRTPMRATRDAVAAAPRIAAANSLT